ncbi:hypothetical protein GCM10009628_39190 [Paeniglutamicibacter kerguelensis]
MTAVPMALRHKAIERAGTVGKAAIIGPEAETPRTPTIARKKVTCLLQVRYFTPANSPTVNPGFDTKWGGNTNGPEHLFRAIRFGGD